MKPNYSFIFPISLIFFFSLFFNLTTSCTKDKSERDTTIVICDACKPKPPVTITIEIHDSSWTRSTGGEYISHLNDLISASVDTIKHIYNVFVSQGNGLIQVPLNAAINYYNGTISLSNPKGENNLIYNSKAVSYYGQVVYEPLPFTNVDVTIEMEK